MNVTKRLGVVGLGLIVGVSFGMTACSGGGSKSTEASGNPSDPAAKTCENVAGPADAIQDALGQVEDAVAGLPEMGGPLAMLTTAVGSIVDAVDGLAVGLQAFAETQDPAAFANVAAASGPAILCAADQVTAALETLDAGPLAGTPAEPLVQQAMAQLDVLREALEGGGSSSGDLTPVTDALVQVASTLAEIPGQVPPVPEAPQLEAVLFTASLAFSDLAAVFDATGRLDSGGTTAAITTMMIHVGGTLAAAPSTGVPEVDDALRMAAMAVVGASLPALQQFQVVLFTVLDALFGALRTVLGATGNVDAFESLLAGLMPGDASADPVALLQGLLGGGLSPDGLPVPGLGDVLGGL